MAENAILNINPQLNAGNSGGSGGISSSPSLVSSSTPSSSSSSLTVSGSTGVVSSVTGGGNLKSETDGVSLNANILLNLAASQFTGGSLQSLNDLPLANLLSSLQQQQQLATSGDSNGITSEQSAALLAALIAQQKLNLPGFPQQQQPFNNERGLIMPSQTTSGQQQQQQSQHQHQQNNSMSPSLLLSQQQQQNLNNTTNQETFIQPILGVAPLGKTPLTKEQSQQLAILDCAYKKLPHPADTERIRNYLPRINVNTPPYYPTTPPVGHDSLDFLCKLSSDTLFFMFYYMEVRDNYCYNLLFKLFEIHFR